MLRALARDGYISREAAEAEAAAPLPASLRMPPTGLGAGAAAALAAAAPPGCGGAWRGSAAPFRAPHFTTAVVEWVREHLPRDTTTSTTTAAAAPRSLRVVTTCDLDVQEAAEWAAFAAAEAGGRGVEAAAAVVDGRSGAVRALVVRARHRNPETSPLPYPTGPIIWYIMYCPPCPYECAGWRRLVPEQPQPRHGPPPAPRDGGGAPHSSLRLLSGRGAPF